MTINFPTQKVRDFLDKSKLIVTEKNDYMPILRYIRIKVDFGVCIMTKTNNNSFCRFFFDLDAEDNDFLIEESKLILFCETSSDENFSITIDENSTVIYGLSYKQKTNAKSYSIDEFPKIPAESKSTVRITKDIIDAFVVAKSCMSKEKDPLQPMFSYVYSKNDTVFSSNRATMFTRKFNRQIPHLSLTLSEINAVAEFPFVDFSETDNYNTYKNGNVIYGFIHTEEARPFDYESFIGQITKDNFMSLKVSDILNFCTSTIKFADSKFTDSDFYYEKEIGKMIYQDKEKDEDHELEVGVKVVGESFNFRFLPVVWKEVIGSLPYEEICIGQTRGFLTFWNPQDEGYVGIITKTL